MELADNCDLGGNESSLARDSFIAEMSYNKSQRELLRETVKPPNELNLAINYEINLEWQIEIVSSTFQSWNGSYNILVTRTLTRVLVILTIFQLTIRNNKFA